MADEPEVIRDQMQETRTALTEKLEALESQVANTVQSATTAVTDTVEAVKETVSETVSSVKDSVESTVSTVKESVKDAFDIEGHVRRHPWASLLGSVAVGYIGGRLLNGLAGGERPSTRHSSPREYAAFTEPTPRRDKGANGHGERKDEPAKEGLLSNLGNAFTGELDTIKGLGLSAVAGVVRDLVTQSVGGEVGDRLRQWVDGLTEKMGAKPLAEPVLQQQEEPERAREEPRRDRQPVNVRRETLPRP